MKKILFLIMALMLLPTLASAAIDDADIFLDFENPSDLDQNNGSVSTTWTIGTQTHETTDAIYGVYSIDTDGINDDWDTTDVSFGNDASDSFTYCLWFKHDTLPSATWVPVQGLDAGNDNWDTRFLHSTNTWQINARTSTGAGTWVDVDDTNLHSFCSVLDNSDNTFQFWFDGVNEVNGTFSSYDVIDQLFLFNDKNGDQQGDSVLDLIGVWAYAFTPAQVAEYYNNGTPWNPYDSVSPTVQYAHLNVTDAYDNSSLIGYNASLGTQSNVTAANGIAYFYNNTGINYSVDGSTNYFNRSGTATQNATTLVNLVGALPNITAYNVEESLISIFNLTSKYTSNTTTTGETRLLLPPATNTSVNVTAPEYYLFETNVTTGAQDKTNKNITGLYQNILTINATNAYSGEVLSNWTGWIYNNETGYNTSFSTSSNTSTLYTLLGTHTVFIDVNGYSISASNYEYSNFTSNTTTITFSLYSENSVYVNIYDEETGGTITENVTVTVSGNSTEDIYYTSNATLFLNNLTDGNYSFKFESENYTQRTYDVTVADRSTQILNAFLSSSENTVTFTILDFDTSQTVEDAAITQQRLINSTWTTVESKTSDITGRGQFTYDSGVKYRFIVSKSDYDTKVFELDPIIFTSYNIRIQKNLAVDQDIGLFDVTIYYTPKTLFNNENNTFTLSFSSEGGTLESYGYILNYPSGTQSGTGTSANGQTFNTGLFEITGAQYGDYGNLTYWYDSTLGGNKTYNFQLYIENAANNQTIASNQDQTYGLGVLERIIIATIVSVLFAGVLTLFGNALIGLIGGLIAMGIFVSIGFVSLWIFLPGVIVGVLMLMRRSSD